MIRSSLDLIRCDHQDPFREMDAAVGFVCPHCRRLADQHAEEETTAGLLGVAVHVKAVSTAVRGPDFGAVLDRVHLDVDRWYCKRAVWHAHGGVGFDPQGVPLGDYDDPDDMRFGPLPPFVAMKCGRGHRLHADRAWMLSQARRSRLGGHDSVCLPRGI